MMIVLAVALPDTVTKPVIPEVIEVPDGVVTVGVVPELPPPLPPQATKVLVNIIIAIVLKKPTLIPLKVIRFGLNSISSYG